MINGYIMQHGVIGSRTSLRVLNCKNDMDAIRTASELIQEWEKNGVDKVHVMIVKDGHRVCYMKIDEKVA